MQRLLRVAWPFLLCILMASCGKSSSLDGRVVDGKGQPMAGLTILATPSGPVEGCEPLETVTDSEGAFEFTKLCPSGHYVLAPRVTDWSAAPFMSVSTGPGENLLLSRRGWLGEGKWAIMAAPEGESRSLPAPVVIRPAVCSLAGKVADGQGRPLAGVKLRARLSRPLEGAGEPMARSGPEGEFRLNGLLPDSSYHLSYEANPFTPEQDQPVRTPGAGETEDLSLSLRFIRTEDGVLKDTATGLEWFACPEQGLGWDPAKKWAENLAVAGGGWNMPGRKELKSLQVGLGNPEQRKLLLPLASWDVWSCETDGSAAAPTVSLSSGRDSWCRFALPNAVLAVRKSK